MHSELLSALAEAPVIAAVKDDEGLAASLGSRARVVFVLYGSVVRLPDITRQLRKAGKLPLLHLDLLDGLAPRQAAVDYIAASTSAAGVLSTKAPLLQHAHKLGLFTVRRYFLLDSLSLQNCEKSLATEPFDCVEVLPGAMPQLLGELSAKSGVPLIAGGLVRSKQDVFAALSAGAVAVSTSRRDLWDI